jgi:Flp pilus assembly pilin Flp
MKNQRYYQAGSAQGLVEYALLLVLIAIAVMLGLRIYGVTLEQTYCNIASFIGQTQACEEMAYCRDSFTEGSDGWSTNTGGTPSGNWQFSDGQLCGSNASTIYNVCSQGLEVDDYTINLGNIHLHQGDGYGVYLRSEIVNGQVNGYTFQYDPGLRALVFRKWVNGRELSPFATYRVPSGYDWYSQPRNVQVKVSGNTFTAYIDGEAVLTAQDDTYPSGGAGLRTWNATQFCTDEFSILPNQP